MTAARHARAALLAGALLAVPAGAEAPAETVIGADNVQLAWLGSIALDPRWPAVRALPGKDGTIYVAGHDFTDFILNIEIEGDGRITACAPATGSLRAITDLCRTLLEQGRFVAGPELPGPFRHGHLSAYPVRDDTTQAISLFARHDRGQVRFAGAEAPPGPAGMASDGTLQLALDEDAYPAPALREEHDARVAVWIGFDKAGAARDCRPAWSSNGARLAYRTCWLAPTAARFRWMAGKDDFAGLRYLLVRVDWRVPRSG